MFLTTTSEGSLSSLTAWWLTLLVCGLLAWPMSARLFPRSRDSGYFISKALGLLVPTYVVWLLSSLGWISFSRTGALAGMGFLAFTGYVLRPDWRRISLVDVCKNELVFIAFLSAGVLIRALTPEIYGLEKFMDFGFMNAGLRADAMPPPDPWFAGAPVNYYYFGHMIGSWTTLVSGVRPDHGYNLMMGTVFALSGTLVFALVRDALPSASRYVSGAVSALTAAAVVAGGNFHTVIYGALRDWSGSSFDRDYYYPDSTRYIGFDPPTDDKGFTEMAGYGFAVGDMHGHVLALPIGFLILQVIFGALARKAFDTRTEANITTGESLLLAFLFSLLIMTNSWNFAIYGLFLCITGLLAWVSSPALQLRTLVALAGRGVLVVAFSIIFAFPFLINFVPFGEGVRWVEHVTPLWQWLILYAHLIPGCLAAIYLFAQVPDRRPSAVLAAGMAVTALTLLVLPEIVYVKDIYGADHMRANTMFKLTFQAQALGVIAAGLTVGLLLTRQTEGWMRHVPLVLGILLFSSLIYPRYWLWERLQATPLSQYSLDGSRFMAREAPGEEQLVSLVAGLPLKRGELVLEGYGNAYTYAARFSALTGQPTALGWPVHEWLWRGSWDTVAERMGWVVAVYEAQAVPDACRAMERMRVRYLIVGDIERRNYPKLRENILAQAGRLIAAAGNTNIYSISESPCG